MISLTLPALRKPNWPNVSFPPIAVADHLNDHFRVKAFLLAVVAAGPIASASAASKPVVGMKCFHENATVRLTGRVEYQNRYGPPNYGENPKTDRLMHVPILRLDRPITPCKLTQFDSDKAKVGKPLWRLQLSGSLHGLRAGQRRAFAGTIHPATMGPEFLEYIFEIP